MNRKYEVNILLSAMFFATMLSSTVFDSLQITLEILILLYLTFKIISIGLKIDELIIILILVFTYIFTVFLNLF